MSDKAELAKLLPCPPNLPPAAKTEWLRVSQELAELGILSRFDRSVLMMYCCSFASWSEAVAEIEKSGAIVTLPNGYKQANPYLAVLSKQSAILLRACRELGFTPSSRAGCLRYDKSNRMLLKPDSNPPIWDGVGPV